MDWAPGDLALCINARPYFSETLGGGGLRYGAIYTVQDVIPPELWANGIVACGLVLAESRSELPTDDWPEFRFTKVTPGTEDAFDREVIAALNSEPVHARNNDAVHNSCQREGFACASVERSGGGL